MLKKFFASFVLVSLLLPSVSLAADAPIVNYISGGVVHQYIFINCNLENCGAIFERLITSSPLGAGGIIGGQNPTVSLDVTLPAPVTDEEVVPPDEVVSTEEIVVPPEETATAVEPEPEPVATPLLDEPTLIESPVPPDSPLGGGITAEPVTPNAVASESLPVSTINEPPLPDPIDTTSVDLVLPAPADTPTEFTEVRGLGGIRISEFLSDPNTGDKEWVELYNPNSGVIDLTGYSLLEGSGQVTHLTGELVANDYRMIEKSSLNNVGDIITLKNVSGEVIDQIIYGNWPQVSDFSGFKLSAVPAKGKSMSESGTIFVETEPTPGVTNILPVVIPSVVTELPSTSPLGAGGIIEGQSTASVEAIVSSVDTTPPEVTVPVTVAVEIDSSSSTTSGGGGLNQSIDTPFRGPGGFSSLIRISEFLPNPVGTDDTEWIELYNADAVSVDLKSWSIDDDPAGGSAKHLFNESTVIEPQGYLLLPRSVTGLALNNDKDSVVLKNSDDVVISSINYTGCHEGQSWAYFDTGWSETSTLTPGSLNLSSTTDSPLGAGGITGGQPASTDASQGGPAAPLSSPLGAGGIVGTDSLAIAAAENISGANDAAAVNISALKQAKVKTIAGVKYLGVSLEDVRLLPLKTKVTVRGEVVVLPGTFGKSIMYLKGSGIQVYFSKSEWPAMKIGDEVEVSGTLAESYYEMKINVAKATDIAVIGPGTTPEPMEITSAQMGEPLEGYFVTISGELLEKNGKKLLFSDELGEFNVELKSGTKLSSTILQKGEHWQITGILSQNGDIYRILPRGEADLTKIVADADKAPGVAATSSTLPPGTGNRIVLAVLGSIFAGLLGFNAYVLWKRRAKLSEVSSMFVKLKDKLASNKSV